MSRLDKIEARWKQGHDQSHNEFPLGQTPFTDIAYLLKIARAAEKFIDRVESLEPRINSAFALEAIHGEIYAGPHWGDEKRDLRTALKEES